MVKKITNKTKYLFSRHNLLKIVLLIFAISPVIILFFYPQLCIEWKEQLTLGNWIYWITFLALIWYADETRKIREIEQTPIIDLYATDEGDVEISKLTIKNNGKGIAYGVKIENIITDNAEFDLFVDDINNILLAGNSVNLDVVAKKDGNKSTNTGDSYFQDNNALKVFSDEVISKRGGHLKVVIMYQNYLGKNFKSVFGVSFPLFAEKDKDKNRTFKKAISVTLLSRT